jgi:hypothetical protein
MKAMELRIGNFIYKESEYEFENGINQIISVLEFECVSTRPLNCHVKHHNVNISNLKPIPLTEEGLLKFGFEHQNKYDLESNLYSKKLKSEYHFTIYSKTETLDFKTKFIGWKVLNIGFDFKIEYVHQLQNLFFCLCGEELKLKDN